MENPIKMDDLGVPLLSETPICNFKTQLNSSDSFGEKIVYDYPFRKRLLIVQQTIPEKSHICQARQSTNH